MEHSKPKQKTSRGRARPASNRILSCPNNMKWTLAAILPFIILVTGCISIPEENWVISQRSPFGVQGQTLDCAIIGPSHSPGGQAGSGHKTALPVIPESGLNAWGFSFTTWNIHKGKAEGWDEDFQYICRSTDILILQEAYLSDKLKNLLQQEDLQWDLAAAYAYQKIESGVLTASKIVPNLTCSFMDKEPITRVPKSILITRYPISGTHGELLVANVHAINFSTGYAAFQRQCDRLENMLATHEGPMIVSGDFNTWNAGRMSRVNAMAKRLNLSPVPFGENQKSKFFGQHVDHIYYRELEIQKTKTLIVATSDHNPLTVEFKVAEGWGEDS